MRRIYMNIEIANRLVQLRKKNNLSQEALAGKLGISRQAVSKWERAEASPDTDNLILLARIYDISLDELLKTDDDIPVMPYTESEVKESEVKERDGSDNPGDGKGRTVFKHHAHFPIFSLILIIYVIIGCVYNAWHPGWLLFFLAPIWYSLADAIEKKNANRFAYPLLVVLIYLCLGFFGFLWHPGWVVFFTIPFYYSMVNYVLGLKGRKDNEEPRNTEEGTGEDYEG